MPDLSNTSSFAHPPTCALILAAGKGSRLGAHAGDRPKPLVPLAGRPIIEHNIVLCCQAGVTELCINLHHLGDQIVTQLGDGSRWNVHITYSHEAELLGTAGAVVPFRSILETGHFYVVYGDNYSQCDLRALWQAHQRTGADMTVAVHERPDVRGSGVVIMDATDRIVDLIEKPTGELPDSRWVNAGIYLMEPSLLADIGPGASDFARDHIPRWIRAGKRVFGFRLHTPVLAIDTPEQLYQAQQQLKTTPPL